MGTVLATAVGVSRVGSPELARKIAAERGEVWGHCVFNGGLYVGPPAELDKMGVLLNAECRSKWTDYNKAQLNGFLAKAVVTADDFARWNAFLMFRESNEGEAFLTNARDFLAKEGWEPYSAIELKRA